MTVIEVLGSCIQRVQAIRLPVAEAANTLQLAGVAEDIQACINTLAAHAEKAAQEAQAEGQEDTTAHEPQEEEPASETGESERTGEEDDECQDV